MDVKRLQSKLKQFPSSFDIEEDFQKLSKPHVRRRREILLRYMKSNPYYTGSERCRDWNSVCVYCYVLGESDAALEFNRKTRELCPENIVALTDLANILLRKRENFERITDFCKKVNDLRENKWLMLAAKAQIAYCLLTLGMPCYVKATGKLREILRDTEIQDFLQNDNYMEEISDWTFTLANMEKRLLNFHNSQDEALSQVSRQKHKDVSTLFASIIRIGPSSSPKLKRLKAWSYVELGLLVDGAERNKLVFPNGLKDLLPEHKDLWMQTDAYFKEALRLGRDDRYVLERCGKYFRYAKDIELSVSLLERALEIEETAFAHHHLALSLKRRLEIQASAAMHKGKFRGTRQLHLQNEVYERRSETGKSGYHKGMPFHRQEHRKGAAITMTTSQGIHRKRLDQSAKRNLPRQDYHAMLQRTQQNTRDVSDRIGNMSINSNSPNELCECLPLKEQTKSGSSYRNFSYETKRSTKDRDKPSGSKAKNFHEYNGRKDTQSLNDRRNRNPEYNGRIQQRSEFRVQKEDGKLTREQVAIQLLIKSPRTPQSIVKNQDTEKTIEEIHRHLDKAYTLSESCRMLYDKGLFLRGLQETQSALEVFKKIFENQNRTEQVIPMLLANAYEQAGLCLLHLLLEKQQLDADHFETDMKTYFRLSIEISSGIAKKIPFLKGCWESAPTLTNILLGHPERGEREKDRLSLLSFVYENVENYGGAIAMSQKLLEMATDGREKANILLDIARQYWKGGEYDNAAFELMHTMLCTSKDNIFIDDDLFLNIFIDGGFAALKAGHNKHIARKRFLRALCFSIDRNTEPEANIEDTENIYLDEDVAEFDIFILCDVDSEDKGDKLKSVLRSLEITATVNTKDGVPGTLGSQIIENFVTKAKHVIVVYDKVPKFPGEFAMNSDLILQLTKGNILVVTSGSAPEIPTKLSHCKSVKFDIDSELTDENEDFLLDDALCSKVREIIFQLSVKTS